MIIRARALSAGFPREQGGMLWRGRKVFQELIADEGLVNAFHLAVILPVHQSGHLQGNHTPCAHTFPTKKRSLSSTFLKIVHAHLR